MLCLTIKRNTMNNFFNIKRFGLVLIKDLRENVIRYLLYFLLMFGIMALIMTSNVYSDYRFIEYGRLDYYSTINLQLLRIAIACFIPFGIVFASLAMDPMRRKTQRISYLIVPASNFEKYFSRWLIVTIGYIITFFVALWLADLLRMAICSFRYPELEIKALNLNALIYPTGEYRGDSLMDKNVFQFSLSVFFLFQSLFILGSLFWEKLSFVKTFAVIAIIIALFFFLCWWAVTSFYPNDFDGLGNVLNSFHLEEKLTEKQAVMTFYIIFWVFVLLNWVLSFFRFRESEIIKRW